MQHTVVGYGNIIDLRAVFCMLLLLTRQVYGCKHMPISIDPKY